MSSNDPKMTSNDLEMTSNDLKMTSNDRKKTSEDKNDGPVFKKVKSKITLRGGDPNDGSPIIGRDFSNKLFLPNKWLSLRNLYKQVPVSKRNYRKPLINTIKNLFQHNQKYARML